MSPLYMGEVEGELDFVSAYFLQKQRITMNNEHHRLYFSRHPPVCSVYTMPMCPVPSIVYCTDYLVSALARSDLLTLATMLQ